MTEREVPKVYIPCSNCFGTNLVLGEEDLSDSEKMKATLSD
jgi:hypothetical protein